MIEEIHVPLEAICNAVPGALAATVMGYDGVPVDSYEHQDAEGETDVSALLIEYSCLLGQVKNSAQMFAAGDLKEFSISSDNLTALIRPINEEFILALALSSPGYSGKGRFLLRVHAPNLAEFLT